MKCKRNTIIHDHHMIVNMIVNIVVMIVDMIVNMDETPMWFGKTTRKTVHSKGAKAVYVWSTGAEKRRLTAVLAAIADGQMLPPMVIFKGKRKLKNVDEPRSWIVCVQAKGWMDSMLMDRWVREIYLKHKKWNKALCVMDSFSAHYM